MQQLRLLLIKKRIKRTRHREEILRLFLTSDHHLLTAAAIYEKLYENDKRMNPSTVYRNLDILSAAGIIRLIPLQDGIARYELVTDHHHHHLICMKCQRMEIIDFCPFDEINAFVRTHSEFIPMEHRFEIYGYCGECKNQTHSPSPGRNCHDHHGY